MNTKINKDTTICMSLAARPTNFGTRFHNYLYNALELNYLYKAFTSKDLTGVITGMRALNFRGCAISMPFKEEVIALVDELDPSAAAINSVNTIVNTDGHLKAYNTDYIAISTLLTKYAIPTDSSFALKGSGGMAKAVACALRDLGFTNGVIVATNEQSGKALADLCGFKWQADMSDVEADLLINATPLGMSGGPEEGRFCFSEQEIEHMQVLFDVVAIPSVTPAVEYAKSIDKTVITGSEVFAIQAVEQFQLYTGIRPSQLLFEQAAAYSRSEY
ncbi:shikimate 5-dehydrogenase [Vibrio rumoiensis]|uniref:Shikimate 5-dehydrogenase n=1 Tax=Vibrio rumoiensis 1S-45 TaxID=1188252 RepID=A0A1E5E1T4_9VIBR|nr:shikimate 5-dehydrogenase [Vibrio rumoiensis]OEF25220.1 shikimate 5-dehydrogenase [Vibrio rumoiensis 1S-45]